MKSEIEKIRRKHALYKEKQHKSNQEYKIKNKKAIYELSKYAKQNEYKININDDIDILSGEFIYTLSDPTTNEICYVGRTNNIKKRYKQHIETSKNYHGNIYMSDWIANVVFDEYKKPIMNVINTYPMWEIDKKEKDLIKKMIKDGHPLLNRLLRKRKNFFENIYKSEFYKRIEKKTGKQWR